MHIWATPTETIWTSCEGIPSGFLSMILPSLLGCMLRVLGTAGLLIATRMSNLFSAGAIVISMPAHPKDRQEFDGFMIFASLEKMSKIYANAASMSRRELSEMRNKSRDACAQRFASAASLRLAAIYKLMDEMLRNKRSVPAR